MSDPSTARSQEGESAERMSSPLLSDDGKNRLPSPSAAAPDGYDWTATSSKLSYLPPADRSPLRRRSDTDFSDSNHSSSSDALLESRSTSMATTTTDTQKERQRKWTVFLYSITTVLLYADQNLLAPNLTAAANEFGFSNDERDSKLGGAIALAFFVLGAPASLLVGCLADSWPRAPLFCVTVCIGEGACLVTYFTTTYRQLYVCRALTGFSVGGALPLVYSVLGDLFEAKDRPAVSALVGMGCGIGISLGQGIAGFLGPRFGWRFPFLVVSIPALVCALLVLWTVKDPVRGGMEEAVIQRRDMGQLMVELTHDNGKDNDNDNDGTLIPNSSGINSTIQSTTQRRSPSLVPISPHIYPPEIQSHVSATSRPTSRSSDVPNSSGDNDDGIRWMSEKNQRKESPTDNYQMDWASHFKTLRSLLSCRTVLLTLIQGAPGCVPWGIVNTYLNDYLSEDRGMTVQGATLTVLLFGFGNFLGLTVGGVGGKYLYNKSPEYPPILSGTMAILGCLPFWLLINTVDADSSLLEIGCISILAGTGSGVTGPIVKSTLQNVTLPNTRGQAFALLNTFDDFGRGLGPVFVAMLIANLGGRTPAFNVGIFGWVICGLVNLLIQCTVVKDEQRIQAILSQQLFQEVQNNNNGTNNHKKADRAESPLYEAVNHRIV